MRNARTLLPKYPSNESLTIEFLSEVLGLKETSDYGLFYSKKIKCYLHINAGILTDFQYDDGLSTWARELRNANNGIYELISKTANKYRPDDAFMAQREINTQCDAWAMVPQASGNEFADLHRQDFGVINYHMLLVAHYTKDISEQEFTELNFGRYQWDKSWQGEGRKFDCGYFSYQFNGNGELLDVAGPVFFR